MAHTNAWSLSFNKQTESMSFFGFCCLYIMLTVHSMPLNYCLIMQGNYTSDVAQFFINMVTYWILYSYLVPISLFVTMEIVKFWQVCFVFRHHANAPCHVWMAS